MHYCATVGASNFQVPFALVGKIRLQPSSAFWLAQILRHLVIFVLTAVLVSDNFPCVHQRGGGLALGVDSLFHTTADGNEQNVWL